MKVQAPAKALIVVDSSLPLHTFISREILPVIDFWGIPCEIFDLAHPPDSPCLPEAIGVVVLLQEGLPLARLERATSLVNAAVAHGAGVVNFDHTLDVVTADEGSAVRIVQRIVTVRSLLGLRVAAPDHFTAAMQQSYREFRFKLPIPAIVSESDSRGLKSVPLRGDGGVSVLECSETGVAVANWRISIWLWSKSFFGFTRGLDAFFWRSLLWAAKKPFAIVAFPPFGRFRIDDCRGLVRTPQDAAFLDVLEEFGEVANLGICLEALTDAGWEHLAAKARAGKLEVAPHVLRSEQGVFSVAGDVRAPGQRDEVAAIVLANFEKHRCPMSKSVSDHSHEISLRGLAIARELGLAYRMNVMRAGEPWRGAHQRWHPAPFGSMHFALDRLPDDAGLFTAINHIYTFSDSLLTIAPERFICPSFPGFTEDHWDFLNGNIKGPNAGDKDIDRARQRLQRHAELCLTSLFFAGSITHTHFCLHLALEEWRYILAGYRDYADRFGYIPLGYDGIAHYAASRADLSHVEISAAATETRVGLVAEGGAAQSHWVLTARGATRQPNLDWASQSLIRATRRTA